LRPSWQARKHFKISDSNFFKGEKNFGKRKKGQKHFSSSLIIQKIKSRRLKLRDEKSKVWQDSTVLFSIFRLSSSALDIFRYAFDGSHHRVRKKVVSILTIQHERLQQPNSDQRWKLVKESLWKIFSGEVEVLVSQHN
jgi:hypothetical protein